MRCYIGEIAADSREVVPKIDLRDLRTSIKPIVCPRDGRNPTRCILQASRDHGITTSLQIQHAGHQLQAVLDPVVDLFDKHLLMLKRFPESAFVPLPLNGHAKDIGRALQEGDVVLGKFPFGPAVHLQNSIGRAVALQDHIHGAAYAVQFIALRGDVLVAKGQPAEARSAYQAAIEKAAKDQGAFRESVRMRLEALGG